MKIDYIETQDGKIRIENCFGMDSSDIERRYGKEVLRIYQNKTPCAFFSIKYGLQICSTFGNLSYSEKNIVSGSLAEHRQTDKPTTFSTSSIRIKRGTIVEKTTFEKIEQTLLSSKNRLENIITNHKKTLVRSVNF